KPPLVQTYHPSSTPWSSERPALGYRPHPARSDNGTPTGLPVSVYQPVQTPAPATPNNPQRPGHCGQTYNSIPWRTACRYSLQCGALKSFAALVAAPKLDSETPQGSPAPQNFARWFPDQSFPPPTPT